MNAPDTTPYPAVVAPPDMEALPFAAETKTLFRCVSEHDFPTLAALCDDDFGIIDLGTEGQNVVIETRAAWEDWFHTLFARLDAMQAHTATIIEKYQALAMGDMGYSVVNFCQLLTLGDHTARFYCVVTVIWKRVGDAWKESRWHCSLIRAEP
ncbi:MAG: nuclear transport factor 2 family protein [bacterium]|nr:nuclear transport factor 2 family protein [bacterium]